MTVDLGEGLRALGRLPPPAVPVVGLPVRMAFEPGADGAPRPPAGRETATAVISALAAGHGAWGVRVHDVTASVDALKVVQAWKGIDG